MNAQQMTARLGGKWHGSYGLACCPAHEDRTPSLSIQDGDRAILFTCHGGCDRQAILAALRGRGLWSAGAETYSPPPRRTPREEAARRAQELAKVQQHWREAAPADGTPVVRYLTARGIALPVPPTLRYLATPHPGTGVGLPCMVAAVTDPQRQVVAVHRTWLRLDGLAKAPVSTPRMLLGSPLDGAIRLAPAGETLGLAEGIETALSAMQIFRIPVWSAINAARLDRLALPGEVRRVVIFADHDGPGLEAARRASDAYRGRGLAVSITAPEREGNDWNDVLQAREAA